MTLQFNITLVRGSKDISNWSRHRCAPPKADCHPSKGWKERTPPLCAHHERTSSCAVGRGFLPISRGQRHRMSFTEGARRLLPVMGRDHTAARAPREGKAPAASRHTHPGKGLGPSTSRCPKTQLQPRDSLPLFSLQLGLCARAGSSRPTSRARLHFAGLGCVFILPLLRTPPFH